MPKKVMVLLAVAGLLVLAFAGPRAGLTNPPEGLEARRQYADSIRMLRDRARSAALPPGIDANKVIKQVRRDPVPKPLDVGDPIELCEEFMPAPDADDGAQYNPVVAFDGTNYLVVWQDAGPDSIYGARVKADGVLLDPAGFVISTMETYLWNPPSVAFNGTDYLVVWMDVNWDIYGARVSTDGEDINPITILEDDDGKVLTSVASDGAGWLVVWASWFVDGLIHGALVDPDGTPTVLDNPISNNVWGHDDPSVGFGGSYYLVAWEHYDYGQGYVDIRCALVDPEDGGVATRWNITEGWDEAYDPSVASDNTDFLVVWDDGTDVYGEVVYTVDGPGEDFPISTDGVVAAVAFDGTDYLVAWDDNSDIYGCQVSPGAEVGTAYLVSTRTSSAPAVACGPGEYTVLVAYQSATETPYNTDRIWARPGILPMDGDVGTDSVVRPVASFLMPSYRIPPMALVKNHGEALRTFRAKFTITPGSYTSTKTVLALAADEEREVTFAPFTLSTGVFTAECQTLLADDGTPGNDTKTAIFQGCDFISFFDLAGWDDFTPDPPTGKWARGEPQSPWTLPPMDDSVWGNRLTGVYSSGEYTTLMSPTYVALRDDPAIAFQHNFDTESLHDGGNFSYKTTDPTWDVLTPSAGFGYGDTVKALHPDSGWTGNSSGWVQSVFTIPVSADTVFRVRWNFASDAGTNDYGWLIDEVAGIGCELTAKLGAAGVIDTLKVWPNPVRGAGQVSYNLLWDCNVTIKLHDATGRLAARVPTSGFKKGRNTATLDASRLASGVYFVKLESESDTRTTKVIIQ